MSLQFGEMEAVKLDEDPLADDGEEACSQGVPLSLRGIRNRAVEVVEDPEAFAAGPWTPERKTNEPPTSPPLPVTAIRRSSSTGGARRGAFYNVGPFPFGRSQSGSPSRNTTPERTVPDDVQEQQHTRRKRIPRHASDRRSFSHLGRRPLPDPPGGPPAAKVTQSLHTTNTPAAPQLAYRGIAPPAPTTTTPEPTPTPTPSTPVGRRQNARVMNSLLERVRPAPPSPSQNPQQPQPQYQQQAVQQQQQFHHQQQQIQQHSQQFQQHHLPPHANFIAMNGMNGGGVQGAMAGMPTPAGHQSELNYIYGLVEELSKQLAENRRQTEEIVSGIGRVRNRARSQALGNEELINAASEEINGQEKNLDALVSILTEALEKSKYSRDANAALLNDYAQAMGNMVRQVHDFKANQVEEVSRWHHSYRRQLAEAREENCRLREQIWDMQARASRANESLREFRSRYEESEERWGRRVDAAAARQEVRFWKRMAMPEIPDDDPYWSDDDDLIDIKEKIRQREMAQRAREQQEQQQQEDHHEDVGGMPAVPHAPSPPSLFGGVAMQRDESSAGLSLPSRPSSAASTGSSGQ